MWCVVCCRRVCCFGVGVLFGVGRSALVRRVVYTLVGMGYLSLCCNVVCCGMLKESVLLWCEGTFWCVGLGCVVGKS